MAEATVVYEPQGNAIGRVTLATTLASLIPPVVAALVVVGCFLVGILSAETSATVILAVLSTAGLTTGSVLTTGKKTPTDRVRREVHYTDATETADVTPLESGATAGGPAGSTSAKFTDKDQMTPITPTVVETSVQID